MCKESRGQPGTSFLSGELESGEGGCLLVDRAFLVRLEVKLSQAHLRKRLPRYQSLSSHLTSLRRT